MSLRSAPVVVLSVFSLAACAVGSFVADDAPATPVVADATVVDVPSGEVDGQTPSAPSITPPAPSAREAGALLPADAGPDVLTIDASTDAAVVDAASPIDAAVDATTGARAPLVGDVVISEIAYDPAGPQPASEWFEVGNLSADAIELRGIMLRDGVARTHTIGTSVVVPGGGFVVLARSRSACVSDGVPATAIAYEYGAGIGSSSGVLLANGSSGAIELVAGGVSLVRVPYGAFSLNAPGSSLQLRVLTHQPVANAAAYCASSTPTPGVAPVCP